MAQLSTPELSKALNKARPLTGQQAEKGKNNSVQYLMLGTLVILISLAAFKSLFTPKHDSAVVQVVSAGMDIPAGCKIDFGSLHYLNIPKKYYTPGMMSSYEELIGKTTSTYIRKGNPFLKNELLPSSLSLALSKNERAITLRLDPEMQVDHSLRTGDKVDVLVTLQAHGTGKAANKKYTKTLAQNISVLIATPREAFISTGAKISDANRVTLAASPEDCERLTQASDTGKLRLVLRNRLYQTNEFLAGSDERDLLPHFAQKEIAEEALNAATPLPSNFTAPTAPILMPPPPPAKSLPEEALSMLPEKVQEPIQWVVEMFSGSKKETYAIPAK